MEYGQPAVFDPENEQYFSEITADDSKRRVLVHLNFNRITEIDTVNERFRCQFWISFSWLPTFAEWTEYKEAKSKGTLPEWRPHWVPVIVFPELVESTKFQFAERPNVGSFQVSRIKGIPDEIGYDPTLCRFIRCRLECDIVCDDVL